MVHIATGQQSRTAYLITIAILVYGGQTGEHEPSFSHTTKENTTETKSIKTATGIKSQHEILIGGLFPVHEWENGCSKLIPAKGVQRLEAMLWAVDNINNRSDILPNITLVVHILDTCSKETYAFQQTFEFVQLVISRQQSSAELYQCRDRSTPTFKHPTPITAVIGAASSVVSVQVANLLGQFQVPQISYSSTGTRLSEDKYQFFSRVVPPDNLQASAMVDVVAALNWTQVHAIADRGDYGELGIKEFQEKAQVRGISIEGLPHIIEKDMDFGGMLMKMYKTQTAKKKVGGVVMFVNEGIVNKILAQLTNLTKIGMIDKDYFMFIASDSWGKKIAPAKNFEEAAIGTITIAPKHQDEEGFAMSYGALSLKNNERNPWFEELWNHQNCQKHHADLSHCMKDIQQESYVPYVIKAVNVLAYGLHKYLLEDCKDEGYPESVANCDLFFDGLKLQRHFRNISLPDEHGKHKDDTPVIDENGDGVGEYTIWQCSGKNENGGGGCIYHEVGHWKDEMLLSFDIDKIKQGLDIENGTLIPESLCARECQAGYYKMIVEGTHQSTNCWTCLPCTTENIKHIMPTPTQCVACPKTQLPNAARNACEDMIPETISWSSPWALAPAVFALLGISACGVVIYTFARYNRTPVIMASGRELCYFMIAGIMGTYMMTFVLVAPPSVVTCAITRVGLGVSMACIYGAILTKTSRLARVFRTQIKSTQPPRFISPLSQIGICSAMIGFQFVAAVVWLVAQPPKVETFYNTQFTQAVSSCKATATHLLISLSWNIVLILACTVYAFKTRKIPENFNETKYIGFTMYATCIIWFAFVPIYFATFDQFRIQITSFSACISLSGTVALGCFFAPKVYIVLFQPEKNVRNKGAVRALLTQQMAVLRTMNDARTFIDSGMPGIMSASTQLAGPVVHVQLESTCRPEETTCRQSAPTDPVTNDQPSKSGAISNSNVTTALVTSSNHLPHQQHNIQAVISHDGSDSPASKHNDRNEISDPAKSGELEVYENNAVTQTLCLTEELTTEISDIKQSETDKLDIMADEDEAVPFIVNEVLPDKSPPPHTHVPVHHVGCAKTRQNIRDVELIDATMSASCYQQHNGGACNVNENLRMRKSKSMPFDKPGNKQRGTKHKRLNNDSSQASATKTNSNDTSNGTAITTDSQTLQDMLTRMANKEETFL